MSADKEERRLSAIEERLSRIETILARNPSRKMDTPASSPIAPRVSNAKSDPIGAGNQASEPATTQFTTQALGWSGAAAVVLAAIYLIRLGIDSGWLSPLRQLDLAMLGSGALIAGGLLLRRIDRQYATYLPAAGIVVLFATIYVANLGYGLISGQTAALGTIFTALLTLLLGTLFSEELYALFATVGSYMAPMFLPILRGNIYDLVIYFSVWSVVFSIYALRLRKRNIYLLAMYLALIIFSVLFNRYMPSSWRSALIFQTLQFAIFLSAAAIFSVRLHRPMNSEEAWLHFPALLLFYSLQYGLLDQHLPTLAPWIALASAAVLLAVYLMARSRLGHQSEGARVIVSAYLALVLLHAVYMTLLPRAMTPWVGLALLVAVPFAVRPYARNQGAFSAWPFGIVGGLILVFNITRIVLNENSAAIPADSLLLLLYPAAGYFAYFSLRNDGKS